MYIYIYTYTIELDMSEFHRYAIKAPILLPERSAGKLLCSAVAICLGQAMDCKKHPPMAFLWSYSWLHHIRYTLLPVYQYLINDLIMSNT